MIQTQRTHLEVLPEKDAYLLLQYYTENQFHLAPWEPIKGPDYLTLKYWQAVLRRAKADFQEGKEYRFVALTPHRDEIIGVCNFTGITRGVFQACHLGYSASKKYEGQGFMQEILEASLSFMFREVGLHRVMANYMPRNQRSGRLLERMGFEREGYARSYLKIAGVWEDHILTSKINEISN